MDKLPVFGILCGGFFILLFAGVGVWMILKSNKDKKKVGESTNWPSTSGTITDSHITESVSTSDDNNITYYRPAISYKYEVIGTSYESNRLMFGAAQSGSRGGAQTVVAKYPVGSAVTVYYNPVDPKEAVLERQSKSTNVTMILGIVFIVMAVCVGCIGAISIAAQYLPK